MMYLPLPQEPIALFVYFVSVLVALCVVAILGAVLLNFLTARVTGEVAERRNSPVATGSMMGFFIGYYLLIHQQVGNVQLPDPHWYIACALVGLPAVLLGTVVNIQGRLRLGKNWANQATIYQEQTLVQEGVYRWVRHPLYASLIWIFLGAAVVYHNWAALLATLLIFIPMMRYRAGLEEKLLLERFPEYAEYQQNVGQFFPKLRQRRSYDQL
ncbi:MAG: isoprenylcysteine carboxylmethyltransferase family protein [bacterium]